MIIPVVLLICLSVVVIYSSDPNLAIQQVLYAIFGLFIYWGLKNYDYRALKPFINIGYILVIILLGAVLLLGAETRGSIRWIPLGLFNLQPSEFAKVALILILANFWTHRLPSYLNILKSLGLLAPIAFFVFLQPDLGTTLTIIFIWLIMLFAANISWWKMTAMGILGLLTIPGVWFFLKDYQKQRIWSFLTPNYDPLGVGYNVIQSTIAVGSGGFWGRGLGRGTQSRLQFLPEFRTDFIFAFIAEELGFFGSAILVFLYAGIFYFCFRVLWLCGDKFGGLIVVGVIGMIIFQMLINIGMNIQILPVTGITLPLVSYGGSSMVSVLMALGIVESVRVFGKKQQEVDTFGNNM